jgi:hypothetical protein
MARKPADSHSTHAGHGHGAALPVDDGTIPEMDYPAHEAMYRRFTDLVKWGIIVTVVVMVLLFILVNPMIQPAAS